MNRPICILFVSVAAVVVATASTPDTSKRVFKDSATSDVKDPTRTTLQHATIRPLLLLQLGPDLSEFTSTSQTVQAGEILTIANGRVYAAQADGTRRQLASSRVLRDFSVRELLDWKSLRSKGSTRLLLTVGEAPPQGLHSPAGGRLWQVDTDGAERFVSPDVFQARLSPDGERLVYATSARSVGVQTGDGRLLLDVTPGYDPSWKPDGRSIVLSRTDDRRDPNHPERLRISTIDVETRRESNLTAGFDDVRPEFHPSGRWVIFVSGARTGFASFWRVSTDGGDARQLTNVGATAVDDRFVPTPFSRTLWSSNGRWFVYDFKLGAREEVWGLEFDIDGSIVQARRIAQGLSPQWANDGVSVAVQSMVDGERRVAIVGLPR